MGWEKVPWTARERATRRLQQPSDEWTKLIHKLRWIGLDEEAQRLERAVRSLPPGESEFVAASPFDAD
jgi:hypothetical protein